VLKAWDIHNGNSFLSIACSKFLDDEALAIRKIISMATNKKETFVVVVLFEKSNCVLHLALAVEDEENVQIKLICHSVTHLPEQICDVISFDEFQTSNYLVITKSDSRMFQKFSVTFNNSEKDLKVKPLETEHMCLSINEDDSLKQCILKSINSVDTSMSVIEQLLEKAIQNSESNSKRHKAEDVIYDDE